MASIRWLYRDLDFRIGDWTCRSDDHRPGPVEATDGHAIAFTRRGVYRKHVGARSVIAEPGTATAYRRGQEYRTSHPVGGGDRCTVLAASDGWLERMSGGSAPNGVPPWQARALDPRERLLARRLLAAAASGIPLALDETLAILLPSICAPRPRRDADCRGPTRARHRRAVERVRLFLAARFEEDLRLAEIARQADYSPTRLCVVFKEHTGVSIHRWLIRLRLQAALERLGDHESLSRLAFELGFSSHSHFTTAFRAEFGATPSRVRREMSREGLAELRRRARPS